MNGEPRDTDIAGDGAGSAGPSNDGRFAPGQDLSAGGATRFDDMLGPYIEAGLELPPELLDEQRLVFIRPGDVIADRFQVVKPLGFGGMGAVYHVKDCELGTDKALKVMLPSLLRSQTARERFRSEVSISQELAHDGIVRVHDLMQDTRRGIQFFTMEYVPGVTLHRYLKDKGGRLPIDGALEIARQICDALEYAHQYTVHRDLKPQNIMVRPDGRIKILDFGLAKLMSPGRFTKSSMALGTAYYQAPEQSTQVGEVDARADIFSLGVILYQMLTGIIPTAGAEPPSKEAPGIPKCLDAVVLTCLKRQKDRRYASAADLCAAMQRLTHKRWKSRHTLVVGALVSALVVAFMTGFLRLKSSPEERQLTAAYRQAANGSYAEASAGFEAFAARYPQYPGRGDTQFLAAVYATRAPASGLDEEQAAAQRALVLLNSFLRDNPNHGKTARALTMKAQLHYKLGQYQDAIDILRDPVLRQSDPESALPSLRTLARSYVRVGDYEPAVSAYQQAAAFATNYEPVADYDELGDVYKLRADRTDDAQESTKLKRAAIENWTHAVSVPGIEAENKRKIQEKIDWLQSQIVEEQPTQAPAATAEGKLATSPPADSSTVAEASAARTAALKAQAAAKSAGAESYAGALLGEADELVKQAEARDTLREYTAAVAAYNAAAPKYAKAESLAKQASAEVAALDAAKKAAAQAQADADAAGAETWAEVRYKQAAEAEQATLDTPDRTDAAKKFAEVKDLYALAAGEARDQGEAIVAAAEKTAQQAQTRAQADDVKQYAAAELAQAEAEMSVAKQAGPDYQKAKTAYEQAAALFAKAGEAAPSRKKAEQDRIEAAWKAAEAAAKAAQQAAARAQTDDVKQYAAEELAQAQAQIDIAKQAGTDYQKVKSAYDQAATLFAKAVEAALGRKKVEQDRLAAEKQAEQERAEAARKASEAIVPPRDGQSVGEGKAHIRGGQQFCFSMNAIVEQGGDIGFEGGIWGSQPRLTAPGRIWPLGNEPLETIAEVPKDETSILRDALNPFLRKDYIRYTLSVDLVVGQSYAIICADEKHYAKIQVDGFKKIGNWDCELTFNWAYQSNGSRAFR